MDRKVIAIKRDKTGAIVAVCNPAESWSPRRIADVIRDISSSKRSYYVKAHERRRYLRVIAGSLQTGSDNASKNALDELPVS